MAVHRPRKPRKARTVARSAALSSLTIIGGNDDGGSGDERLRDAARVVADGSRELSATWSVKVPASISTRVDGLVATIAASAPNARPAEFRLSHPLFGDREHWYGPPGEKFLAPSLDAHIDEAMEKYAKKINDWARKYGWS